ncbi:helix-turn-helix transcriptional regulator [Smaragdicoccus niigatensis]|uniref:helix-turn-helix transcriptional regulator n=1 Tax=Smaragdicoccus niigatensis TaxID=359359 RepID=UPI001FE1153F|nr:helix-turn-helix domain-containing protein [Smaragdicoccus niigatensis]
MTTQQVSDETNIPIGTLRYWRFAGLGPKSYRLGRRRVFYRRSDVEKWLDAEYRRTVTGDSDVA